MRQDTTMEVYNSELFMDMLSIDLQERGQLLSRISRLLDWGNEDDVVSVKVRPTNDHYVDFVIFVGERKAINGGIVKSKDTSLWSIHT